MPTFWQWWSYERYGEIDHSSRGLHDACPPFRTRHEPPHPKAGELRLLPDGSIELGWTAISKPVVLHCYDVFCCHWPQILVAALFGRP